MFGSNQSNDDELKSKDYAQLESKVLSEAQKATASADIKQSAETLKDLADARKSHSELRLKPWNILSSVVPFLALCVTAIATWVQAHEFTKAQSQLADKFRTAQTQLQSQFEQTANQQNEAHENTEWREALKTVSFADRKSTMSAAFAMQGFFDSPRYGASARQIAAVLLSNTYNVAGFDEILVGLRKRTDGSNFEDVRALAMRLGFCERAKSRITDAASEEKAKFLTADVEGIDSREDVVEHDDEQQRRAAAWEIDSASQALLALWRDHHTQVSPTGQNLSAVVLENGVFDGLDFGGAVLNYGILYHASFKNTRFRKAKLKFLFIGDDVDLEGADFSDIGAEDYKGSRWGGSKWWKAKCIPSEMANYLSEQTGHVLTPDERAQITQGCSSTKM